MARTRSLLTGSAVCSCLGKFRGYASVDVGARNEELYPESTVPDAVRRREEACMLMHYEVKRTFWQRSHRELGLTVTRVAAEGGGTEATSVLAPDSAIR